MKSELRNLITCIETPHPQGQVFYLEPVVLKESQSMWAEEGLPFASPNNSSYSEIGLTSNSLVISTESHQVKSTLSLEMAKDLQELHGVNVSDMLKSTLTNEMEQMVEKKILEKMKESAEGTRKDGWSKFQLWTNKWFGYSPKKEWSNPDELASLIVSRANKILGETRMGGTPFVIVSSGVMVSLEDSQYFQYYDEPQIKNTAGAINQIGILAGRIKVLVDPYLRFDDHRILMGIKPGTDTSSRIFMIENPEPIFTETVNGPSMDPVLILRKRFGIKSVESKNYLFIEFAEQGKKHNLFRHLISKIFKK